MKLYKISQYKDDEYVEYDTYESLIVVADNEQEARCIFPRDSRFPPDYSWTTPEKVIVEYIGEAAPNLVQGTVVLASFKAG